MAKAIKRYRGVDLEARRDKFGEIYVWLYRRHDALLRDLTANTPAFWTVNARKMAGEGVRSMRGRVPSADAVCKAWSAVARHHPEDMQRYDAERAANAAQSSRRHKGWVPTSRDPVPSDRPASQSTTPSTRAPAPPPPRAAPSPPAPTAPTVALGPNEAAPLGHPDHPLSVLTVLELADVSRYANASLEVQRNVLQTFRTMHHMDRFNRPGWQ